MKSNKILIGITGNSGSGKTTVCKILKDMGFYTIDCDVLSHSILCPGELAYTKVVDAFGTEVLTDNQKIDRKKLGAIVFADLNKRTLLESIVHPIVIDSVLKEAATANSDYIAVDAVLLVESGLHHHCNAVWLVTAEEEERLTRIIARDSLSQEAAQARMRNQRDTKHIAELASEIIINNGDLEILQWQVKNAVQKLQANEV